MTSDEKGFLVRFRYEGGEAKRQRLNLYDGTASIHGVARAISIAVHGYINTDVIHKATALRGANLYLIPPRRGSFLNDIWITIQNNPVGSSIAASVLYDFLRFSIGQAVGYLDERPYTTYVSKLNTKDEPFFDDLAESMEGALLEGHRPIQSDGGTISMERPRSKLLTFNKRTLEWVSTRDDFDEDEKIQGNITRYNVLSGNGRLYDYELERTVPFRPVKTGLSTNAESLLSWSLDQLNNGLPGVLEMTVRRTVSAREETKRFILIDCTMVKASDRPD